MLLFELSIYKKILEKKYMYYGFHKNIKQKLFSIFLFLEH